MAGCTGRVRLGSMVVLLPWHDAARVAEQVSVPGRTTASIAAW